MSASRLLTDGLRLPRPRWGSLTTLVLAVTEGNPAELIIVRLNVLTVEPQFLNPGGDDAVTALTIDLGDVVLTGTFGADPTTVIVEYRHGATRLRPSSP